MQPPQRRGLDVLRPEQQCAATAGAQNLLCCPQCVRRLRSPNLHQLLWGKADVLEAQAIRNVRRLHHRDRPLAQFAECRVQQPHFTHAGLLDQQVDQRADGPATAGQFGGQRRVAGVNDPSATARELGRPPQGRVYLFSQNGSSGHGALKNLYIYTVSYTQFCDSELTLLIGG